MYDIQEGENLQHYGKKGMRWGVRKSRTATDIKTSSKTKKISDKIKTDATTTANQIVSPVKYFKAVKREVKSNGYVQTAQNTASKKRLNADVKAQRDAKAEKKLVKKDDKWEKKMDKGGSHAAITRMSRSNNDIINKAIDQANIVADKKGSGMYDSDGRVNAKYEKYTNQKIANAMNKGLAQDKKAISPSKRRRVQMIIEEHEGDILLKSSIKK